MKHVYKSIYVALISVIFLYTTLPAAGGHETGLKKEVAIQKLMQGNKRYVKNKVTHPNQNQKRRAELTQGQHPYAVIVTCSDSRVSPEILFDQGLGDLFVIRIAGNVVDDNAMGSIEYAVEHLGTNLIVVLGHSNCGAVGATVKGGEIPGHIKSICDAIKPAVEKAKKLPGDLLENSIQNNVEMVVEKIRSSEPILNELVKKEKIMVVPAEYNISSGEVTLLKEK